ncbi:hypothetical protein SAMN02745823_00471 [Sporobacter termitidis DSM 10068]|uniref:Uncharacterized protein n=2 Tax=Sporobacter TaxID=44748 RepID=A0A1M5UE36_9FIRM|nr:hypothetical protein SAMN02745823_00471 [Sporobacter termitidis DSM 10068]
MEIPGNVYIQKQLTELRVQRWLDDELFSPLWWILIAAMIALVVLWWVLIRREKILEVSLFAFLAAVIYMGICEYGEELTLWDFPTDIIAYFPTLSAINFVLLGLGFSLLYQYFEQTMSFAWAAAVFSAAVCFGADPLLSAAGLYRLVRWHYFESLPIYFASAVLVRTAVVRIVETAGVRKQVLNQGW